MTANLEKIHEMYNILNEKDRINHDIMSSFGRFNLSDILRRLDLEKQQGISVVQLIMSLCLFRINGDSIFGIYTKKFYNLLETGKNCYYRMLNRESMDWRTLLLRMNCRFLAIMRKENAEEAEQPRCYIIDDTTLEKTGTCMEGLSRVYDHVKHKCVLGYKLLLLAYFDGRSTLPADFSLHREKGTEKNYGLSEEEREGQYTKKRNSQKADYQRFKELDSKKSDNAIKMMKRAWKAGLHATYALCDSWFTFEDFIHGVREIGDGSVHFLGMARMDNRRYRVRMYNENVYELISRYERTEAKKLKKYNATYIKLNGFLGNEIVRIFLIKYGSNKNWNVILTTDVTMTPEKCFETYQIRWNIEVLNKESKQYLGLGKYQGRDFDGQVADCSLCYITYIVMAVDKRLNDYETFGILFHEQRDDLMALTLWKRVLEIIRRVLEVLADQLAIDIEELVDNVINDEKSLQKYVVIMNAVEELEAVA